MKSVYFTLLLTAIALSSCSITNRVVPSHEFVTFEVAATGVNSVNVSSSITVEYTQSDKVNVSVSCPENLVDYLKVSVDDGRLTAGLKNGVSIDGSCAVTVTVSSPGLKEIDASSSSHFTADTIVVADKLDIEASSSAQVDIAAVTRGNVSVEASSSASVTVASARCAALDVECESSAEVSVSGIECVTVEAEASSAATVTLSGKAINAKYEASSAATINARQLIVENLRSAEASSAASIRCAANTRGAVKEDSSGTVSFE